MRYRVRFLLVFISVKLIIENNQRLLKATSWFELFALLSNLQSGILCKVYTFGRRLHAPEKLLKIVIITQKGN